MLLVGAAIGTGYGVNPYVDYMPPPLLEHELAGG